MSLGQEDQSAPAEVQREQLQALYQLASEIAELRDLRHVLDIALRHCLELTGSQFGFIGLNTADRKAMDVVAIRGFEASHRFYSHFHLIPLRPNVFARVVLENRPVRSLDAMLDPARVGQPPGHPLVRAFLGVPLRRSSEPMGMIGVANRPGAYDQVHEDLLMAYASQVAIAIRNAQLYEELKATKADLEHKVEERTYELAQANEAVAQKARLLQRLLSQTVAVQERERARIALDLHDGLNQVAIGAILEVRAARERLAAGDSVAVEQSLSRVRAVLGMIESEIKRIIYGLRPPTLDALGLPSAITRYAERFRAFSGLECDVRVRGREHRLNEDLEITIYRVMQEALQNSAAHAHAARAWVHLNLEDERVVLEVGDDGQGFDPQQVRDGADEHLGIAGMHERALSWGGSLTIMSAPGTGTRVVLEVPLSGPAAVADYQEIRGERF